MSDLAPLIIEQVKLLEEAVEKEIFNDLVAANKNADQFIYKKFIEPEEKKAEEAKKAEGEKKAEEHVTNDSGEGELCDGENKKEVNKKSNESTIQRQSEIESFVRGLTEEEKDKVREMLDTT